MFVLFLVLDRPGIYLSEIQSELRDQLGPELSISAICKFLHLSGFTHQRLKITAIQRDEVLRAQYVAKVSMYRPEMLVYLDESGCDRRDCLRKKGYSLRGKPAKLQRLLVRGQRVSVIAFLSFVGLLDLQLVTEAVDSVIFYDFVQEVLLPHLMPFSGQNLHSQNPHSVVILDNCSIHHVQPVVRMIQVGALVHFLPSYSPDYNPIEQAFCKAKKEMQTLEDSGIQDLK